MPSIFKQARIKLTIFYLVILMSVTLLFSTIVYFQTLKSGVFVLNMQKARIERQLERFGYSRSQVRKELILLGQEEIEEIKHRTLKNLLLLNSIVLGISGILSYFLAGRTLKPIEQMLAKQRLFVSSAAHELKTPLTAIKTNLEVTLRDKNLNIKDAKTSMQEAIHDVDKLNSLAVMLLKQESVNSEKNFTKIDLFKLVEEVTEKISPIANEKGQKIDFSGVAAYVNGNAEELTIVFTNLLDNAIKYNKDLGTVSVKLFTERKTAKVTVSDQGAGIDKKDLPYIFDSFYRADKARGNSSSFGLGLSIANQIVQKHGGKIEVASETGVGSTFTVSLGVTV